MQLFFIYLQFFTHYNPREHWVFKYHHYFSGFYWSSITSALKEVIKDPQFVRGSTENEKFLVSIGFQNYPFGNFGLQTNEYKCSKSTYTVI